MKIGLSISRFSDDFDTKECLDILKKLFTMSNNYHSYFKALDAARQSYSSKYDADQMALLLEKMDANQALLSGSSRSVVFLLDLLERRYLSMSPSVLSVSGYSTRYMMDGGLEMAMDKYHPEDGRIYSGNIFFKNMEVLHQLPDNQRSNYCFNYNYRFKTRRGEYRSILQKLAILQSADGTPLLMLILATDITNFKTDSRILHTIEDLKNSGPRIIYAKTYFTEERQTILSLKEKEVIKWIADGLTSNAIAEKLSLSIHTVHNHRKSILEKTDCANAAELLQYVLKNGLI